MIIEETWLPDFTHFIDYDLGHDAELSEILELASAVTDSPYAFISFFDENTQYLKVRKGVTQMSVPKDLSFCRFAILQTGLMMVPDTLMDERFSGHPSVAGEPHIRFFASIPLIAQNGQIAATLCVLDVRPRVLDDHQQLVIKILSNQVMKIVELKAGMEMLSKNQQELKTQKEINLDANNRLRSFFESSTNFQVLLGKQGEVIDFNKTAFNFVKTVHKTNLKRGDIFKHYIHPDFTPTFISQYDLALQGVRSAKEGSTDYEGLDTIWWEASFEAARDVNEQIIGVSYLIRNVTERKLREQKIISQNQALLKIAHIQAHEFRAPLTTIMGLMNLISDDMTNPQSEYIPYLKQAVEAFDSTIKRIVGDIDQTVINDYAGDLQKL